MNELQVLEHDNVRVLTTEQLAEAYGCSAKHIKQNFNNNKERFVEGKHYYYLEGEELRCFKRQVENIDLPVSKFASAICLWTKQGAARHCKMLGTEKAWDVFDDLEENYFSPGRDMSSAEFLLHAAQRMVEQEKELRATKAVVARMDNRLLAVESKQMTIDQMHYTIIGYANLTGVRGIDRKIAAELGHKASILSRKQGYRIGKEYDAKYGCVNTYHVDILQMVFRSDDE